LINSRLIRTLGLGKLFGKLLGKLKFRHFIQKML